MIYVLRAHKWDDFTKSQFYKLKNECENVFLLYDNSINPFPHDESSNNIILINQNECFKINPLHKSTKDQIESQLILFRKKCPLKFDYIWLIEYDVYCDGNWLTTLHCCDELNDDFLATNIYAYKDRILWNHWFGLYGKRWNKPLLKDRMSSFFPITRFSNRFIDILEQNLSIYSGFCEVYIPTLAKQNNLSLQNIPSYIIHPIFFSYKPSYPIQIKLENKNILYHPVTNLLQLIF